MFGVLASWLRAFRCSTTIKKGAFRIMTEPLQSADREVSSRFGFLKRPWVARWAPIPLRLIVGYGFMAHGFAKLARGPEAFPVILHALGVPAPHFLAWAVPPAPGAAASESGRLCYGDGAEGRRPRPERA